MDILNSDWLISMLKKSSESPHGRLLSLFEILEDWLNAPNIAEQIKTKAVAPTSNLLQDYLTIEAAKAGVAMPKPPVLRIEGNTSLVTHFLKRFASGLRLRSIKL